MKNNLKMRLYFLILCLITFSFGMLINYNINADEGPGISISPEYPKEQITKDGNFNVMFKPNQYYDLTLDIANTNGTNKSVNITPNTAYTSNNGNIVFDKTNVPKDSSKKYDFRSLFNQKERKVTIPANSMIKTSFKLKMPPKQYQGIILGGFYINILNDNQPNIKNNIKIYNKFYYGLAAIIHDNNSIGKPNLKLGNVNSNNNGNNTQINSNIKNIGSGVTSGMNINSKIIKDSNNKVVSKSNRNSLSMAPNSAFNYEDTIENSLSPGNYKVHLNITDDSGHTWNVNKDFKVNTREYVTHFTQKVPWTLYILIGVIVLLALIIVFLVYYQFKNKHKENNQSRNNTKN